MREMKNAYEILFGRLKEKKTLGRPRSKLEN
jgi:hypothetical protein